MTVHVRKAGEHDVPGIVALWEEFRITAYFMSSFTVVAHKEELKDYETSKGIGVFHGYTAARVAR